jgi:hypothetical protein
MTTTENQASRDPATASRAELGGDWQPAFEWVEWVTVHFGSGSVGWTGGSA